MDAVIGNSWVVVEELAAEGMPREKIRLIYNGIETAVVGPERMREEGFSNVILEAMAAGLPMIVTNVGGAPEAVLHEETGLIVPAREPAALGRGCAPAGARSGSERRLGDAGRMRVTQEFSVERCVNYQSALHDELLSRSARGA